MLNEDIAAVRKMYPTLSDADFEYIVKRFDPTYRAGSDSVGRYGKWLLNLAKKGDFEVDGSEEQVNYISALLSQFEKKKASLDNKDIGQFKSLAELSGRMQNTAEPELTARQKERQMRKAYKNAELIWQDDKWQVWYPQNWDAACTLGKGTSWCTADSRTAKFYVYYTTALDDSDDAFDIKNLGSQIHSKGGIKDFLEDCYNDTFYDEINLITKDLDYQQSIDKIIEYVSERYSPNCVVEWGESGVWFYDPHSILPYSQCGCPLFIFINKKDPSDKYQLYCGDLTTDGFDDVDTWDIANKNDRMYYFRNIAWDDRSFADFASDVLGVIPQSYFMMPPPWDEEYDEEE